MAERLHPKTVRVMTEWFVTLPLWSDDPDLVGPFEADELDLSRSLVDDLTAWNAEWERQAGDWMNGNPPSPDKEAAWAAQGPQLVARLQAELGEAVHVYLWEPPRKTLRDIPRDIAAVIRGLTRRRPGGGHA